MILNPYGKRKCTPKCPSEKIRTDSWHFRHSVTVYDRTEDQRNAYNEIEPGEQEYCTRVAAIIPVNGKEYFENNSVQADITHRVRLRSDSITRKINPKQYLKFTTDERVRTLEIVRAFDVNEAQIEVELLCVEAV